MYLEREKTVNLRCIKKRLYCNRSCYRTFFKFYHNIELRPYHQTLLQVLYVWNYTVDNYICAIQTDPLVLLGASWLSWGLVKGAEYTGKAIQKGASKLREHITPEDKPTDVSPTVTKSLHVAKQATGGAVKVSQFLGD